MGHVHTHRLLHWLSVTANNLNSSPDRVALALAGQVALLATYLVFSAEGAGLTSQLLEWLALVLTVPLMSDLLHADPRHREAETFIEGTTYRFALSHECAEKGSCSFFFRLRPFFSAQCSLSSELS